MNVSSNSLTVNSIIRLGLLIVLVICVSGLNIWVVEVGGISFFALLFTMLCIGLFTLYIFLNPRQPAHYFSTPIIAFLILASFFLIHFFFTQGSSLAFDNILARFATLIYFPIWYLLLQMDKTLFYQTQKTMACLVLVTVPMLVYHVFFPFSFTPIELSNPGRASGFYLNPNLAGMALIMSVLSSISIIPSKWKSLFLVWAGIGVFVTFSRSAILVFVIVTIGMIITREVDRRQSLLTFSGSILVLFFVTIGAYQYLKTLENINLSNVVDRVLWFQNIAGGTDYSAIKRKQLFWEGLRLGTENPLWGQGIGALSHWSENLHNSYLLLFVEYGVLGLLLLPAFVITLFIHGYKKSYTPSMLLAVTFLFHGIFSHNTLFLYTSTLFAAILFAAAENKQKYRNRILRNDDGEKIVHVT